MPYDILVAADLAIPFRPKRPGGEVENYMLADLRRFAAPLRGSGLCIKIGVVYDAIGPDAVTMLQHMGLWVCVDRKFHNTPDMMAEHGRLMSMLGVDIVTIMCQSDISGMKAFKEAAPDVEVLGVAALTTMNDDDCKRVHNRETALETVLDFAEMARESGLDGMVLSGHEVTEIGARPLFDGFSLNVPGIRPSWSEGTHDQKRVVTHTDLVRLAGRRERPVRAIIGRPISRAENPRAAAERIIREMEEAEKTLQPVA